MVNLNIALTKKAINRRERYIAQDLPHYSIRTATIIILSKDHLPHCIHIFNIMSKEERVNKRFHFFVGLTDHESFRTLCHVETPSRSLVSLLSNPIFLSAALSIFLAQIIKAVLAIFKRRKLQAKEIASIVLWKTGGMPSSHAALVVSLSASIAFIEGFSSLFILSFFLGLIVIRDALGVRRSAGLQAQALNLLGKHVAEHLDIPFAPVKEILGHRWQEVLVGCLLGLAVSTLVCWRFIFQAASSSM